MTIWVNGAPIKSNALRKRKVEIRHIEPCSYAQCRNQPTEKVPHTTDRGENVLIPLCNQHRI